MKGNEYNKVHGSEYNMQVFANNMCFMLYVYLKVASLETTIKLHYIPTH